MSEFMEKHSVSRLIGAPPGYVGYQEGGVLTEAVRRRPYCLVVLDEFEKAHREVSNLFLQLMDEGHLTDSHGRKVDFKNAIVVMTSNIGSDILSQLPEGVESKQAKNEVMGRVSQFLPPEFINRIDDIILFNRLTRENIGKIVEIQISEVKNMLKDRQSTLNISEEALSHLGDRGYDPVYGARPLKRLIQKEILAPLSELILQGKVTENTNIFVDFNHNTNNNSNMLTFDCQSAEDSA